MPEKHAAETTYIDRLTAKTILTGLGDPFTLVALIAGVAVMWLCGVFG